MMKLEDIHSVRLCTLPTPLVAAPRLSDQLGGPRIFFKRDDLTGLSMGGNKARCLEFLMAEAKDKSSDTVIALGPQQSNWLCAVTAAARKMGMDVILFLLKGSNEVQGNLLLDKLLGADIRFTDVDIKNIAEAQKQMENLAKDLSRAGHKPYVLPYGPVPTLGIAGYVSLGLEICQQLEERNITADHVFLGSGSGCTQAGLILGAKQRKASFKINGVMLDPRYSKEEQVRIVAKEANEAAKFLGMDFTVTPEEIICHEGYSDYQPTEKVIEAVRLLARTEGIFIDPAYTGKVMAALIDQIRQGRMKRKDTVVFYHSGGLPYIFVYNEMLSA